MNRRNLTVICVSIIVLIGVLVVLQRNTTSPKKVIVVGAGISGLATAHELHAKGNTVTILEAKDVIGGRIQSTKVNGQNYELGASFIHGNQNNPVATILEQAGVSTSKVDFDNIVVYKNGHKTEVTDDLEPFFSFVEKQKNQLPGDQSLLRTWQTYSSPRTANANELLYRLRIDTQTEIGADLSDISTLQFDEESGLNGGDYLVTGGYDKVISALSKDIDIRLKHIVTTIKDDGNRVIVSTANNETFTADEVVVTVPLGVLQKGSITFEPVLPKEKLFAVGKLKMGNLHKTFLTFDHVFWDNTTTIGIMRGDGTKWGEFINLAPATGTPTLLALHGGADATSLESLSDAVIGQQAYEVLASAYPKATRPTTVVTSKWYADPFTLGSYSYVPPGASLDMYDTIAEPYGHIHFAGEHTNSSYPSTTHGAYLSGIRAAKEILH